MGKPDAGPEINLPALHEGLLQAAEAAAELGTYHNVQRVEGIFAQISKLPNAAKLDLELATDNRQLYRLLTRNGKHLLDQWFKAIQRHRAAMSYSDNPQTPTALGESLLQAAREAAE